MDSYQDMDSYQGVGSYQDMPSGISQEPSHSAAPLGAALLAPTNMPLWNLDDWQYIERETITDPNGRRWTIALMDVLGQEGDPDMPNSLLELQYSSGRYFTLIYADGGALQRERGYASLPEATTAYGNLLVAVIDGSLDPSQPVFRQDLED
jgi:hypothetical protein